MFPGVNDKLYEPFERPKKACSVSIGPPHGSDGGHSRIDSLMAAVQNPNLLIRNPEGRHCERSEAIQSLRHGLWIASSASPPRHDGRQPAAHLSPNDHFDA
jgi:hypothetical protein